jgi:hypothetical protein
MMDSYAKAVLALLKLAEQPREAVALARCLLGNTLSESQYRALLAAVGAFAKDNESYFVRYDDSQASVKPGVKSQFNRWINKLGGGTGLHWLIFRKPNEPRMRAAYEVLAGWVLKFLYQTRGVIPVDYADGQARVWSQQNLPTEEELWKEFVHWFPNDLLESNVSTLLDMMGSRIGTLQVPAALIPKVGRVLAEMAIRHPRRFQNHISFNNGLGLKDLVGIIRLDDLKQDDGALSKQLETDGRVKMDLVTDAQGRRKSKGGDLLKATGCARRVVIAKRLAELLNGKPRKERTLHRYLSCLKLPKANARQLLDDLVAFGVLVRQQDGTVTRTQKDINWLGLAYVESVAVDSTPPFTFAPQSQPSQAESRCLACGSPNIMPKAGTKMILPESKKVWYERPKTNEAGDLCAECFFAALISGFYPSEAYSVCELPATSAYQTFLLAQRLSNVTASLGAMTIARSSLLTVLPSRYFLVRLATGRGALPKKVQLYLLLADYALSFPPDGVSIRAYVKTAGAINYLEIDLNVLRILNLFRRGDVLPPHFTTEGNAKARANDTVCLLEAGRPYAALYRLLYDPYKDAEDKRRCFGERTLFQSPYTLETFDTTVQQGARTLLEFLLRGGESKMFIQNPEAFYQDIKSLSDALYDLLQPIAQDDVNQSRSKVSVIVRKYVDAVEKRFPQLNLVELQYMVAKAADDAEKWRAGGKTVHVANKEELSKALDAVENEVSKMYGKYFQEGNAYVWREFIKEVAQRLLARLLLGVRAAQQ